MNSPISKKLASRGRGWSAIQGNRMVRLAITASVMAGAATGASALGDNFYWQGGVAGSGVWDSSTDTSPVANWSTPIASTTPPLTTWISSTSNIANFDAPSTNTNAGNITLGPTPLTAASLVLNGQGYDFFPGTTGTPSLTLGSAATGSIALGSGFLVPATLDGGNGAAVFTNNLSTGSAFIINTGAGSPVVQLQSIGLAGQNSFGGPIQLTGTSPINIQLGSLATTSDRTVSGGVASPAIDINALQGSTHGTYPTLQVSANQSELTNDAQKKGTQYTDYTNDYVVPNNIALNPNGVANFTFGMGAGSMSDSESNNSDTKLPSNARTVTEVAGNPGAGSINFTGVITGTANILLTNDMFSGGGKGVTILQPMVNGVQSSNTFTGSLVIANNGPTYQADIIGNSGAIPASTDLNFYGFSKFPTGALATATKTDGALDLDGHSITIRSLQTDFGNLSAITALGITNTNAHALDTNWPAGDRTTGGSLTAPSIVTIDSAGANVNTTYAANIWDGYDFLLASEQATPGTQHQYFGGSNTTANSVAPQANIAVSGTPIPRTFAGGASNGLQVGLSLAPANTGTLTLAANAGNTAAFNIYAYSGGTTIYGGSLYVNGILQPSASGAAPLPVVVETPNAGNKALLGGSGSILYNVEVKNGATLQPGASAITPGSFTIGAGSNNATLTLDAGSNLNLYFTNGLPSTGSNTTGVSSVSVTGGLVVNATPSLPVFVQGSGTFSGFENYASSIWNIVSVTGTVSDGGGAYTLGNGYNTGDIQLPFNSATGSLIGLPSPHPFDGTWGWKLVSSGTTLQLSFTKNPNASLLQWTGPSTGTWNTTATNWENVLTSTPGVAYTDDGNGNVQFSDPASNTTINIQSGGVSPATMVFSNTAHTYTLTNGSINGNSALSIIGSGKVTLAAPNGYTGGTSINGGGTVETQTSGALGSTAGPITFYNGTWSVTTADQIYANSIVLFGDSTVGNPTTTSTFDTATNLTLSGNISGIGSLTKQGAGTLTITGNLNQSGGLAVNAGTLQLNTVPAFNGTILVASGAVLTLAQPAGSIVPLAPTGQISGTVNVNTPIVVSVAVSATTYSGSGTFYMNASGISLAAGGTSTATFSQPIVLNQSNTPNFNFSVTMGGSQGTFAVNGPISGAGDVYFGGTSGSGAASFSIGAANTYSGNTFITTGSAANVTLNMENAIPTASTLIFGVNGSGGGTLQLNGFNQTLAGITTDPLSSGVGGINNSVTFGLQPNLTINGTQSNTFDAPLNGFFDLTISLPNSASLTLSHTNNYLGHTTVNGGTLSYSKPTARPFGDFLFLNGTPGGSAGEVIIKGDSANISHYVAQLQAGYNGGAWNYSGLQNPLAIDDSSDIISSNTATAANMQGIGWMLGSDYLLLHNPGDFAPNKTVGPDNILLKYTYLGDANLDGVISVADYAQIDAGFLLGESATWLHGDFNYDGVINYLDFALIDAAFSVQSGALADGEIAQHAAEFGAPYLAALNADLTGTPLPEPTSLALLALGTATLLTRRRR